MPDALKASRYNFAFESADGRIALFNARTGALLTLDGAHATALSGYLVQPGFDCTVDMFDARSAADLLEGGFLVAANLDELSDIRDRFWTARGATPPILTITTTMECNLGCYYCYEQRSGNALNTDKIDDLVTLARRMIDESPLNSLHVDWYGGEPLLNLEFMERASEALIALSDDQGVRFSSSIISNGTVWPADTADFIARHRVTQVQISFDGMKLNHDKRRHYRKAFRKHGQSSFDKAVAVVDSLVRCVRVDLRYNIDRGNLDDLDAFVEFAKARSWFSGPHPAVLQPARLAAYSETSRFMEQHQLSLEEFDTCRAGLRQRMAGIGVIEESEVPDGYPYPRTSVCAALANHSHVVGGEAAVYRCGLQVGEAEREVGNLKLPRSAGKPDTGFWDEFDPTRADSCSVCAFLPICWGGCPKKHLEGDRRALDEQGRYWRTNLPRLVAERAGFVALTEDEVPRSMQFRS